MRHSCYYNLLDTGFRYAAGSILYGISYDTNSRTVVNLSALMSRAGPPASSDSGREEPGL